MAAAVGALTLTLPHVSARAAEVKVLSAIGMRQVMLDLGPKFERATGYKLAIAFDSTGLMAKRVASGEQVDVVLINRSAIGILEKDGKVIASSVTPIAASVAAVAVRRGAARPDISSPEAFRRMLLSAKSVARPSPSVGGSSGDHIARVLEHLGISDQVNAKSVIVMTGTANQIADSPGEAVTKGKADVALHQLQELMVVPGLEIVGPFPGELQGSFAFSAALGTNAREAQGGRALIEFLLTPAARGVIKAKGMEPITP
ncbi:MAG: substrate-binding domain-containing protein [Vicinamibacterales bacterium]|jgi:molybdate transport system substrate-binding protein